LLRAVLQSQSQAKYDPSNIGHYGLALPLYSHFTSPIRRYADLVVHRALLRTMFTKGKDEDETPESMADLERVAGQINVSERKSQMAEWESRDRLVAQHFAGLVGKEFEAIVISVVPFGCFVAVEGVAEGLLPKWDFGRDWVYVAGLSCWRKVRGKGILRVGAKVPVVLKEADALGGRLTFGMAGEVVMAERTFDRRPDSHKAPAREPVREEAGDPPVRERNAQMEKPKWMDGPRKQPRVGGKPGGKAARKPRPETTMGRPLGKATKGNSGGKPKPTRPKRHGA
jgi:ribonuclease R